MMQYVIVSQHSVCDCICVSDCVCVSVCDCVSVCEVTLSDSFHQV